ncbi:MAG: carbohydrate-binding domain-containing protein [Mycolicibacterium sp.]|uniref:carbohydrate-binding domain-containing protein n=1 Tax=Mycolicibacterium sp. TaxID=2320850 RepID=UPI003D0E8974
MYIGQFSALSIALGIGAALAVSAGTAFADTGESSSPSSSAEGAGPSASASDTAGNSARDDSTGPATSSSSGAAEITDRRSLTAEASAQEESSEQEDEPDQVDNSLEPESATESPRPTESVDELTSGADPIDPSPAQNSILLAEVASAPRPRDSSSDVPTDGLQSGPTASAIADSITDSRVSGDVVIDAESMTISDSSNGQAYSDATATGGTAVVLQKNSTVTTSVSLPAFTELVVRAKADRFWGSPVMTVSVDGETVSRISVSAKTWTDYSVAVAGAAGEHTVSIAFTNDFRISYWGDRNLMIDSVTAVAAVAAPTAEVPAGAALGKAAATPGSDVVVQAESLKVAPKKNGSTYSDSAASGGKALVLQRNSTASASVTLPEFTGLVIRARGDQYLGAPMMKVSVDGKVVSTISVSATAWTDYLVEVSGAAGAHTVSVAFTNDRYVKRWGDRNLRLDTITVIAAAVPEPPDPTPPGDPEEPPTSGTPDYFQGADWLWKPIESNPVLADNSALWVSYLSAAGVDRVANLYQYSVALISPDEVTATTPRYDVKFTKPWGSDPFGSLTVPIPEGTKVPPGSDRQIAILDPTTGTAFGIWQAKYNQVTGTWSGSWGGMSDLDGNGVDQSGSATATNIARYAGVVTAAEFGAAIGANTGLDHALVFSTDIAGPDFVGPATKSDGGNLAGVAAPIPQGYRVQLDPTIDVDAIADITAGEKVIAKTLQTHGAYVVDQGGARMAFSFELLDDATAKTPGAVWADAGLAWDYYDMNKIPWSQLRVIAI